MSDFARLSIDVDSTQAERNARSLGDTLDALAHRGESAVDRLKDAFLGLAAAKGLEELGDKFLEETNSAQYSMAQLASAVKSTGMAAGFTADQLHEQALALEEVSTFSHVAIERTQGILLLFEKLQGLQFVQATQAAADLAARMGTDIPSAAQKLGRALEDPATGLLALRRAGVVFTASQADVIKSMAASGDLVGAQTVLLDLLTKKVGGSAEAMRGTLGGALAGLANDFARLFERTKEETGGLIGLINELDHAVNAIHDHQAAVKGLTAAIGAAGLIGVMSLVAPSVIAGATAFLSFAEALTVAETASVAFGIALKGIITAVTSTTGVTILLSAVVGGLVYLYNKFASEHEAAVTAAAAAGRKAAEDEINAWNAWINKTRQAMETAAAIAAAVKKVTEERSIELSKLTALNAAHGQSDAALKELALRYDAVGEKAKFVEGHIPAQIAAFNGLTDAIRDQKIIAIEMATADSAMADAAQAAARANDKFGSSLASLRAIVAQLIPTLNEYHASVLGAQLKDIQFTITPAKTPTVDPAYQAFLDSKKYSEDITRIWSEGFEKIATDGTKSFHDFFEDVFQMFSKLMARMQQAGKDGFGFKALQLGSAALGAGVAGYQAGSSVGTAAGGNGFGSALGGSFSGAVSGAAIGTAILPGVGTIIGTVVGELTGLVGSLMAGAKAAKERKEQEDQLRTALATSVNSMRVLAGVASPLSQSLLENAAAFKKLRDDTDAAYAGLKNQTERESKLSEINDLEAIRVQQLQAEAAALSASFMNDLQVQHLRAQGLNDEADAMQAALDAGKQLTDAIKQFGASSAEVAALIAEQNFEIQQAATNAAAKVINDKFFADNAADVQLRMYNDTMAGQAAREQQQILQDTLDTDKAQLDIVTKQLDLQQKTVDGLRATVDALRKQSDSLKLSTLSPLSANDRYLEAKKQYDDLATKVAGGDQSSVGAFTEAQNAFLTESRAMFGSSGRYAQDFQQAQILNASLTDHFQAQLTTEEQILAVLQGQSDSLNYQISLMTAQLAQLIKMNQSYVVGSTSDPNFLRENGLAGPTDTIYFNQGSPATSNPNSPQPGPGWRLVPGLGWQNGNLPGNEWLLDSGYPGYANGGMAQGGGRWVGERGPELEFSGPARYLPTSQLTGQATTDEVRAMHATMKELLTKLNGKTDESIKAINRRTELAGSRR